MDLFKFSDNSKFYMEEEFFLARVDPEISDSDELIKSLYYLLWFPGYFGFNWNALYDCLCDFHWVREKKIIIFHEALPNIPDSELLVYLSILRDSVLSWGSGGDHVLEVVFSLSDKDRVNGFLSFS